MGDVSALPRGGLGRRFDAASLRVFDSSAVAVLLELRRLLRAEGKTLQVRHWPRRLESLMGLYGVNELLAP